MSVLWLGATERADAASRQIEEDTMGDIGTAGPEIERRLGAWLTAREGLPPLHDGGDGLELYSERALTAETPWLASRGLIGLEVTIGGFAKTLADIALDGCQCDKLLMVLGRAMRGLTERPPIQKLEGQPK
jgi:hypothetical protein